MWLEGPGAGIFAALADSGVKVLGIESENDLRVALPHLIGKVQKFCNNNAKTPPPTCFVVAGTEVNMRRHIVSFLCCYRIPICASFSIVGSS